MKMMLKRMLSLVLCAVLCMACMTSAFAGEIEEGTTGELNESLEIHLEPETISKSDEEQSLVFDIDLSETVVINAISAAQVLVPDGWSVAVRGVGYTLESGDTEDHLLSVGYDSGVQMIAGAYSDEESYRHIHGLRLTYSVPAGEAGSFTLGLEDLWLGTINGVMVVNGVDITASIEIKGADAGDPDPVGPEPEVTDITLDRESVTLKIGETAKLTTTVLPENAPDVAVTWSSSDETVATVEDGVVTAAAEGEATITASVGELSANCAVTVTAAESAEPEQGAGGKLNESLVIRIQPESLSKSDEEQSLVFDIDFSETVVINAISATKVLVPEGWSVEVKGVGYMLESGDTEDHLLSVGYDSSVQMIAGAYSDEESYRHIHGLRMTYSIPAKAVGSFALGLEDLWLGTIYGEMVVNGVNVTKTIEIKGENGDDPTPADPEPEVTDITLGRESLILKVGETATLTATVLPEAAADVAVTWSSSDENVATVEDGVVTASAKGEATITASVGELSASCKVTVTAAESADPEPGNTEPEDSEELLFHKERALTTLEKQFGKYSRSDYDSEEWLQLVAAYDRGVEDILDAEESTSGFIEDNVTAALNAALEAMQAVPAARTHSITVAVSMDANTLGLGFLIEPTLVTVNNHEQASVVIARLIEETMAEKYNITGPGLSSKGTSEPREKYPWIITGSVTSGFYLAQVYCPEQENVVIPDFILENVRAGAILEEDRSGNFLGEFDYTNTSGWMYSISDRYETVFPGVGASGWQLSDGEVMRWQFTVYGYGSDLGADNTAWGQTSIVNVGDKSALTWKVAELRDQYSNAILKAKSAYTDALAILTDAEASQYAINEALEALNGLTFSESDNSVNTESVVEEGVITVFPDVSEGTAKAAVSSESITEALQSLDADILTITVNNTENAISVELNLDAEAVMAVAMAEVELHIETENGTVTLDTDTLSALAEREGELAVSIRTGGDGTAKVDLAVDGENMDAKLKIELPATEGSQVLVFVKDDGSEKVIKKSLVEDGTAYAVIPAGATVKVVANSKDFDDVAENAWYAEAVDFVSSHELFQGVAEGEFAPQNNMTRAMLVTVLFRLEDEPEGFTGVKFSDVKNDTWYTDAVAWASENGIVNGNGDGFAPNDNITREQIATVLYRYAQYLGMNVKARGDVSKFSDGNEISAWASDAMAWAVEVGLFQGDDTGNLNPKADATRAHVAALIERMVKLIVK